MFKTLELGKSIIMLAFSTIAGCVPFLFKATRTALYTTDEEDEQNVQKCWWTPGQKDYLRFISPIDFGQLQDVNEYVMTVLYDGPELTRIQELLTQAVPNGYGMNPQAFEEILVKVNHVRHLAGMPLIRIGGSQMLGGINALLGTPSNPTSVGKLFMELVGKGHVHTDACRTGRRTPTATPAADENHDE